MVFNGDFTIIEKIELLQRSILVNSYSYYYLDINIISDYQYDTNTRMLRQLKQEYPEEYSQSRYYLYFSNFESGTGFNLLSMIEKNDPELYRRIITDASIVSDYKNGRNY